VHGWIGDGHLRVDGTDFLLPGATGTPGAADTFPLFKRRELVERYIALADEFAGGRIFEAGIYRGGSVAFLTSVFRPEALIAIDIETERNEGLDGWLAARGIADRVRLHHGVDQGDGVRLASLIDGELGDRPLDLVIDDASHLLTPSSTTFDVLFPRLRPGGLYVVEDWSADLIWQQAFAAKPELEELFTQRSETLAEQPIEGEPAEGQLWRLVLRLVVASATHEDVVSGVEVIRGFAAVRRGPTELDASTFRLDELVSAAPV
jgi:predicted O-methyltransferase YrrM